MATWTDLTYSFGSVLTSTKMTQNQANFTALAENASGTPAFEGRVLLNLLNEDLAGSSDTATATNKVILTGPNYNLQSGQIVVATASAFFELDDSGGGSLDSLTMRITHDGTTIGEIDGLVLFQKTNTGGSIDHAAQYTVHGKTSTVANAQVKVEIDYTITGGVTFYWREVQLRSQKQVT